MTTIYYLPVRTYYYLPGESQLLFTWWEPVTIYLVRARYYLPDES